MTAIETQPWMTGAELREMFESVKNWGRWGTDDEIGALNLITADVRRAAVAEVAAGETVSCARELPVRPSVENPHPAFHMMTRGGDDCVVPGLGMESTADFVGVAFHGMATSHIDALCHVFVDGRMYNGFPASAVKSTGAVHGSIMAAKDGIVSRGVLLDICRTSGVDFLEPGTPVMVADLEAAEADQGVTVRPGDILLIGTGRDARRAANGPWHPFTDGLAGLHPECIPWLHEREVAVLGCDGVSDVLPGRHPEGWVMPIHQCAIVAMGVHLLDNLRLDRLADACDRHRQWSFLFTVAPLRVEGGTGSPANPIAVL
ncbi:MAG: cyclase family protein [Acidimicrobiia bacterium]|nr:cyclase family protein [Acidimicrobiia bacterium]